MTSSETYFDPDDDLIIVDAFVSGPKGEVPVKLALDTGCSATTLKPDVIKLAGYTAAHALNKTHVHSAIGEERGHLIQLSAFDALGFSFTDLRVHVFSLGQHTIDGLIGLNFLSCFNYQIRPDEGRILAEKLLSNRLGMAAKDLPEPPQHRLACLAVAEPPRAPAPAGHGSW